MTADWSYSGLVARLGRRCLRCPGRRRQLRVASQGYRGRAGLYEVMTVSPELRRMIVAGASTADMQKTAIEEGMLTLRMDGIMKLRKGVTTPEEVIKETAG